jgi:hypothetical protein
MALCVDQLISLILLVCSTGQGGRVGKSKVLRDFLLQFFFMNHFPPQIITAGPIEIFENSLVANG